MLPEISLGPITLQTFGICFALGFLAAGALVARRLDELGKPRDWAYEMVFAGIVGGLIGGRIDFVLQNWDRASEDFVGTLFNSAAVASRTINFPAVRATTRFPAVPATTY